ncbi:hypothetical protein [Okeania sp. SIO2C2]|nr:hypothetical protein [Okeania sp. SIO2C2]
MTAESDFCLQAKVTTTDEVGLLAISVLLNLPKLTQSMIA